MTIDLTILNFVTIGLIAMVFAWLFNTAMAKLMPALASA